MATVEYINGPSKKEPFTASSFLQYMRKSSPHWWSDNPKETECPWVFRGHWDSDWKLIPTAARPNFEGVPEFKSIVGSLRTELESDCKSWPNLNGIEQDIILRCYAHISAIIKFIDIAKDLSFNLPNTSLFRSPLTFSQYVDSRLLDQSGNFENNRRLLNGISRSLLRNRGFSRMSPSFYFNATVALAQHHGVPTFMLDWSEDPLVACLFATTKPERLSAENGLCVWALKRSSLPVRLSSLKDDWTSGGVIQVIKPDKANNQYLSRQSGVLSSISGGDNFWMRNEIYPDLETVFNQLDNGEFAERTYLRKITLANSELANFRQLLLREGISKAHMMPTFDNVASTALNTLIV